MSRTRGGAPPTFRSATPLSHAGVGPEALRPGITTGLPWTNDGSYMGLHYAMRTPDLRALERQRGSAPSAL